MLSARRNAQLVLGAASLTLVSSITVVVFGSADAKSGTNTVSPMVSAATHSTPLASGHLEGIGADLAQRVASAK